MANVIIKSDERRANEDWTRKQFTSVNNSETREAAEYIAAKTNEAVAEMQRMEGRICR